jgi:hypothetical protein
MARPTIPCTATCEALQTRFWSAPGLFPPPPPAREQTLAGRRTVYKTIHIFEMRLRPMFARKSPSFYTFARAQGPLWPLHALCSSVRSCTRDAHHRRTIPQVASTPADVVFIVPIHRSAPPQFRTSVVAEFANQRQSRSGSVFRILPETRIKRGRSCCRGSLVVRP